MAESTPLRDQPVAQGTSEGRLEIFDPPLCCPTGLCGPTVDKTLLDVNEMVLTSSAQLSCGRSRS
ncbi:MAG: arsenic metallochaperone ArsD family protein [Anaerolineae bacterium]|nr:arsenic metallochaperone ArsD family protein [Anaerolineae bacterium]